VTVRETVPARKLQYKEKQALDLAKTAKVVITGRGKKWQRFEMKDEPARKDLLAGMLGPTGGLRAPALRVGDTLLVGYCEPAWKEVLG